MRILTQKCYVINIVFVSFIFNILHFAIIIYQKIVYFTVTVHFFTALPHFTVITAVPFFFAVVFPFFIEIEDATFFKSVFLMPGTVTTFLLDDEYVIFSFDVNGARIGFNTAFFRLQSHTILCNSNRCWKLISHISYRFKNFPNRFTTRLSTACLLMIRK